MFEDQLSIFGDLFQDQIVPMKKKEDKKTSKKSEKKEKGRNEKKYLLPLTISLMGFAPLEITKEIAGSSEVTEKDVIKIAKANAEWLPDAIAFDYEGCAICFSGTAVAKGSAGEVTKFLFGPEELCLDQISEGKKEITSYIEAFKGQHPEMGSVAAGIYRGNGNALFLIPDSNKAVNTIPLPKERIQLRLLSGEILSFTRNECISFCGLESEEDVTDASEIQSDELKKQLPDWLNRSAVFVKCGADQYLVLCREKAPAYTVPKTTKYDISKGVTISLYFVKYPVTPEDFGGESEIGEDEICRFLVSKGHVEYGFSEGGIVITPYKKKEEGVNYLLVNTRGSKKGAGHPFFELGPDGFTWTGPKVPLYMLGRFVIVARLAMERWKSEILMELFFHRGEYFWYIPFQKVHYTSVKSLQEPWLENVVTSEAIKVGEWHSHGGIQAFFSSVDDADETFPGLYGVVGGLGRDVPSFTWRAVSDRVEVLDKSLMEDVFDDSCTEDPDPWGFLEYVLSVFRTIDQELTSYPLYESTGGKALLMDHPQALFWERFEEAEVIRNQNGNSFLATPGFEKESATETGASCTVSRFLFDAIL